MKSKLKSTTRKEYSIRILRVLDYINNNLSEELTLKKLADVSCFSPFHFHRVFSAFMNESLAGYINRLRLEKAASQLSTFKEIPVTEIALQCGFSSSSVFARAFKSHFGFSATEWRNGKSLQYKKSKNSKTDSNPGKAFSSDEEYFYNEINALLNGIGGKVTSEVKEMPGLHIAYVVNLEGYNIEKIGIAYNKLCKWAGPRGLLNPSTKYIGISLDDPEITPEDKCRFYAGISAPQHIQAEGEIQVLDLPAGKYAVTHYEGPEAGIEKAYKYAYRDYLSDNGYLPGDSFCYEIYYNDPIPEKKFIMDICIPVKPM